MKSVSGKRFAKILSNKGWIYISTTGSHLKYLSPDGTTTVILPVHGNKDLRTGTQRALMN